MAGPDGALLLQFEMQYDLLYQQMISRLMTDVRVKPATNSLMTAFGLLGPSEDEDITGTRHGETHFSDDVSTRRWAVKQDRQVAKILDQQDALAIILDLEMGYLRNAISTMERRKDRILIAAATAIAQSGLTGTETSTFDTAAPTGATGGNQIAVGGAGLTPDKMRTARATFDARQVGVEGVTAGMNEFVWVTNYKGHQDMLEFTEATTNDYLGTIYLPGGDIQQSRMPLVMGRIPYYMGFRIKLSEYLTDSGSNKINLAWHREAMGFAHWGAERRIWVGELPTRNLAHGLIVQEHMGAVRIQDSGVLAIVCDQT